MSLWGTEVQILRIQQVASGSNYSGAKIVKLTLEFHIFIIYIIINFIQFKDAYIIISKEKLYSHA